MSMVSSRSMMKWKDCEGEGETCHASSCLSSIQLREWPATRTSVSMAETTERPRACPLAAVNDQPHVLNVPYTHALTALTEGAIDPLEQRAATIKQGASRVIGQASCSLLPSAATERRA
jgi:hypothetical protein